MSEDEMQDADTAGGLGDSTEQGPAKKHGDPLLNETEAGDQSPVQVPDVAKGTATSAEA